MNTKTAWTKGIIVCLMILLLMVLSACGGKEQGTQVVLGEQEKQEPNSTDPSVKEKENVELRMLWWGSQGRHDSTTKVIELFEKKYPYIKVVPEYSGFDGYWDKLSIQVSGGSAPDVIQMSFAYLAEYANRQSLLDLTEQPIDLSNVDEGTLSTGKINDQLFAIPSGISSYALLYDKEMLNKANIEMPDILTWDKFAEIVTKVPQALGENMMGALNQSGNADLLNYFMRQKGMSFFEDNQIGFTVDALKEYFDYWVDLRDAGAIPSAEKSASLSGIAIEQHPLVLGEAAFEFLTSNAYTNIVNLANRPLEMTYIPLDPEGERAGFITPSMYWSVYEKSKHPEEAALLIDFIINDPEAGEILGVDRGVPISSKIREILMPTLSDADRTQFEYIDEVTKNSTAVNVIEPKGAGEARVLLGSTAQELQFERKTTQEAAEEFIQKANDILDKMK